MNEIQLQTTDLAKQQQDILRELAIFAKDAPGALAKASVCGQLRIVIQGFTLIQKQVIIECALKTRALQVLARDTAGQRRLTDGRTNLD